jgi:NAD(P)-dependent dehydrogenase (short-subunit alcohol dehydrogenase family)
MAARLADKIVIVTGAASGQGAAAARLFAAEGARVAGLDVDADGLRDVCDQAPDTMLALPCDVSEGAAVREAIAGVVERFGSVDVLYNNAAVSLRRAGPWDESQDGAIADITEELFDKVMAINLKSQFLTSKYAIPHMIAAGGGSIINVASVGGVFVGAGNNAYAVSKGGILGLTRALADTYGPQGIRTNLICPGFIETPMISRYLENPAFVAKHLEANPLRRVGQPSEVATVGLFLASDDSSYVNGAVIPVDGGAINQAV